MMPNIIFSEGKLNFDHEIWNSRVSRFAPKRVQTSGITQPPLLAEAVYLVGEKLAPKVRKKFFKEMFDCVINFHQWLYLHRDPDENGLIALVHPYESGLDNSPVWLSVIRRLKFPWWVRLVRTKNLVQFINFFRRDTRRVPEKQRISLADAAEYFYIQQKLKKYKYEDKKNLVKSRSSLEEVAFNSLLIRSNKSLIKIAAELDYPLPRALIRQMHRTEKSLEKLWDSNSEQYFSRTAHGKKLIKKSTITTFMPLYGGSITRARAAKLLSRLKNPGQFNCAFPVPTVPLDAAGFNPNNFWQGPSWINTNWMIIKGLENYGYRQEANELKARTIEMIQTGGFYEYFSPVDGAGKGARNFSWSAALTIDLLSSP